MMIQSVYFTDADSLRYLFETVTAQLSHKYVFYKGICFKKNTLAS